MTEKISIIVEFPFHWARALTIPPCEDKEYDNRLVMLWPLIGLPVNYLLLTGFVFSGLKSWKLWAGFIAFDLVWIGFHYKI